MRVMTGLCALLLSGASFVIPTDCAADPSNAPAASEATQYAGIGAAAPRAKIRRIIDHARPSASEMNMVTIQPATFVMGSPSDEHKRDANEGPQQQITLSHTFEIGKYEVTFNDWRKCVADGGCRGYMPKDGGWGKGNRPVINISWNDSQAYIKWLNAKTGLQYRLPTEAEWEYVARGGQDAPFSTGYSISATQANFNGENPYGGAAKGPYRRKTLPVGSFNPNTFGVYDIHGNVYEWVQDCWSPDHSDAPVNGEARLNGNCKFRVMRGGSWVTHGYQIRASKRLRYTTDYRYDDYGFRLARTLSN